MNTGSLLTIFHKDVHIRQYLSANQRNVEKHHTLVINHTLSQDMYKVHRSSKHSSNC